MSTTLDVSFLRSVCLLHSFKGGDMLRCEAALVCMALQDVEFTAAQLPAELTNGSRHLAGAATGALVAQGLLTVTGRVKSPDPSAKGRRMNLLRRGVPSATLRTWLERNGFEAPASFQRELQFA